MIEGIFVKLILPWAVKWALNWVENYFTQQRVKVADPAALPVHPAPQSVVVKPAGPHTRVPKYPGNPAIDPDTGTWWNNK